MIGALRRRREAKRGKVPVDAPSRLDAPVTAADVEGLFQIMLGRPVWDDDYVRHLVSAGTTCGEMIALLRRSDELASNISQEVRLFGIGSGEGMDRAEYVTPPDLRVGPDAGGRCLLIGACLLDAWPTVIEAAHPAWAVERILFNNVAALPERTAAEMEDVRFQILHMPLRFVLPDTVYFELLSGGAPPEAILAGCLDRLRAAFDTLTSYARTFAVPAFVLGLLAPQRNAAGRFAQVHGLGNVARFVDALNAELEAMCRAAPAVFFYDFDQTAGVYGRKYLQDDAILNYNHGGVLGTIEIFSDVDRLHPVGDAVALYRPRYGQIVGAVFGDIVGAYRSLQQTDAVKLVVFDLDDTLWRSVAAEQDELGSDMIEGWPLGMVEAVAALHARGVLVALASRNDPARAEAAWRQLYQSRFAWEQFFAHEVSWGDKAAAVARIVRQANILPDAALFVDDNPIERERVRAALPGLRTLDAKVAEWKRVLLWSPELQPAFSTREAKVRARTLQDRPPERAPAESREAFLQRLDVRIVIDRVDTMQASAFDRLFELLNKTNQFNTTGRRWSLPELHALLGEGGRMVFARVSDAFNDYGLTAIALLRGEEIVQVVMSCRVFGLGVEAALLRAAVGDLRHGGAGEVLARTVPTGRNGPGLGLFEGGGFVGEPEGDGTLWRLPRDTAPA